MRALLALLLAAWARALAPAIAPARFAPAPSASAPSASAPSASAPTPRKPTSEEAELDALVAKYDRAAVIAFGDRRPLAVAGRLASFVGAFARARRVVEA